MQPAEQAQRAPQAARTMQSILLALLQGTGASDRPPALACVAPVALESASAAECSERMCCCRASREWKDALCMLCGLHRLPLRALPALGWLLLRLTPPSRSGAHPGHWNTVLCADVCHAEPLPHPRQRMQAAGVAALLHWLPCIASMPCSRPPGLKPLSCTTVPGAVLGPCMHGPKVSPCRPAHERPAAPGGCGSRQAGPARPQGCSGGPVVRCGAPAAGPAVGPHAGCPAGPAPPLHRLCHPGLAAGVRLTAAASLDAVPSILIGLCTWKH